MSKHPRENIIFLHIEVISTILEGSEVLFSSKAILSIKLR